MRNSRWKSKRTLAFLILASVVFISYFINRRAKDRTTKTDVSNLIGQKNRIPNNYQYNLLSTDTTINIGEALLKSEYKILLYVDSAGCMTCKLHLSKWNNLIKESEYLPLDKLSFLLFFHQNNKKELSLLIKRENFNYPVFIDVKNEINQLNNFPTQSDLQCFLLDKDNKVLLIGNPVKNSKIKELYMRVILSKETGQKKNK